MESFPTSLLDRITADTFEFSLRGWKEPAGQFFAPTPDRDELLAERQRWLAEHPERHLVHTPQALDLIREAEALAQAWDPAYTPQGSAGLPARLYRLGTHWEVDFILCQPGPGGPFCMAGGVVCFPSRWAPEDKTGLPVADIHSVVPGLNVVLGRKIEHLLDRLPTGQAWLRLNWGLSASPEHNQHPRRDLPRLDPSTPIEYIWLRLEHQCLVRLPASHGILFGIQLYSLPLASLRHNPAVARALAGQLRSMPQAMQDYKGIKGTASRAAGWLERLV